MAATVVVPSLIVHELLNKDNYEDWSFRVETYLIAKGLWNVVEAATEPPKGKDKREAWNKINAEALHAIHICCGNDAFSFIRGNDSAKKVWDALAKKFGDTDDEKSDLQSNDDTSSDGDTETKKESEIEDVEVPKKPKKEAVEDDAQPEKAFEEEADDEREKEVETVSVEGDENNANDYPNYEGFYDALDGWECNAVIEFVRQNHEAVRVKSPSTGMTALHVAVTDQQVDIVKELVHLMTDKDLEIADDQACTALDCCSLSPKGDTDTMVEIAKCLVAKNKNLLSIADSNNGQIPLLLAFTKDRPKMVDYLYSVTPLETEANVSQAAELISRSFFTKRFDTAWNLIQKNPSLAFAENLSGDCPFYDLACMRSAFFSGKRLKFWEKWIYDRIHIGTRTINNEKESTVIMDNKSELTRTSNIDKESTVIMDNKGEPAPTHVSIDVRKQEENDQDKQQSSDLIRSGNFPPPHSVSSDHFNNTWRAFMALFKGPIIENPHKLFGIDRIYHMKLIHVRSLEFLSCMLTCEVMTKDMKDLKEKQARFVQTSIFQAVERGLVEFVTHIFKTNSDLGQIKDEKNKNLFQLAVECRQEKIFNLIRGFNKDTKEVLFSMTDDGNNNMLHMVGLFSPFAQTNRIRGAALQMQKELQWFEELERMASPEDLEAINDTEHKPRELFTKNHIELVKEGEKSMKETATSCTVVGALIVTMMFAAAFTVPGGNNSDTGLPILLKKKAFRVFIIADAISLFASTTSVMLFLGILTSRYAEDDFLISLPRKMILGLLTLFLSVAAMMIAFASALFLILPADSWIALPTTLLTGIPIASFVWMQFPFLVEIFTSTYIPRTFVSKNVERWEKD